MSLKLSPQEKMMVEIAKRNPMFLSIVGKICQSFNDDLRAIADSATKVRKGEAPSIELSAVILEAVNNLNDTIKVIT